MTPAHRVLSLLAVVTTGGCAPALVPHSPQTTLLGSGQNATAVRDAVVRALAHQKLAPENEAPGRIAARPVRRSLDCLIGIEYTEQQFTVRQLGGASPQPGAPTVVDERCVKVARRLARVIQEELGRPAREAAEAQQRARQHELAVEAERRRAEEAALEAERTRQQQLLQQQQQGHHHHHRGPAVTPVPLPVPAPTGGVNIQHRSTHQSGSQSITCCINGAFYSCPSQDAFRACMSTNPSQCARDPGRDGSCR